LLLSVAAATAAPAAAPAMPQPAPEYGVVELRRYTIADGERARFARYFDTFIPEAHEQLGAILFGQFLERGRPNGFTWLRGFRDMPARAIFCANFYYGPLWKALRTRFNAILPDSDNVLLLKPLRADTLPTLLPALDPVDEARGAQGIVVAQLFALKPGSEAAFAAQAEKAFASYTGDGVRAAGLLATLDAPNNFPQLPVRTDGPYLVWLGLVRDTTSLKALQPKLEATAQSLAGEALRGAVETIVMDPTPRSRLRWVD
jgi:hypothetical protein